MRLRNLIRSRLLEAIPTLFGLSVLIFTLTRIIPGDPVRLALGPRASAEEVARLSAEMGLDQPIYIQYINWIMGLFSGDWGMSLRTNQNVYNDIMFRLPATIELVLLALFIAVLIAVPAGMLAAVHKDKWQDNASRFVALIGVSLPSFWLAILLQLVFAVRLGVMPLNGRLSPDLAAPPSMTRLYLIDSLIAGQLDVFIDALRHLLLPAIALGTGTLAQVMRLLRSDVIEELQKEHVMASRSYGLPENLILWKHILKNAFSSSLTVIGLAFGLLLGNAFVIEIVFSWPGMARYGIRAVVFQDFNAVVGVVMIIGLGYMFANFIVDILYGYLDPRIRMEGS